MKVVLDSNILLVAIGKRSRFRPIWDAFIKGNYSLIVSEEILLEYQEVLLQHVAPVAAAIVMEIFIESPNIIFKRLYYYWNAIPQDVDDNKFFNIAVAANTDYLVTNDTHFNAAKTLLFPHVNIISANEFMDIIVSL